MSNYYQELNSGRTKAIFIVFSFVLVVFLIQLFRLQVVDYDTYRSQALASQQKKFTIPAVRGEIYLDSKDGPTPLVLNETRHIVWVDPTFITSPDEVAKDLAPILKRSERDLKEQIEGALSPGLIFIDENLNGAEIEAIENLNIDALKLTGKDSDEKQVDLYVDFTKIDSTIDIAQKLSAIIDVSENSIISKLSPTQYLEIARDVNLQDATTIEEMELKGVGFVEYSKRVYPEDQLAAQLVGFVNTDGEGQYGIEQYYSDEIKGVDGQFKAVTDTRGVPLRASDDNILIDPVDGAKVSLTVDRSVQAKAEDVLKNQVDKTGAEKGSAIVMDANTGKIIAMANYPSYVPSDYIKVANAGNDNLFVNNAISSPYEAGSIIKIFTVATAIEQGVFDYEGDFYDPNQEVIDDFTVKNTTTFTGTRPTREVITYSLNTGAIYALRQMGSGQINNEAKQALYEGFTDRFRLNQKTQIELANEINGVIREPDDPLSSTIGYANMTFGQGFTVTQAQAASAYASIVNGGTHYSPYIVDNIEYSDGEVVSTESKVIDTNVVSKSTSEAIRDLSEGVLTEGLSNGYQRSGYMIGGKTGSAQLPLPDGTYSDTQTIGSFMGFVDNNLGDNYVIITRIDRPQISGYAGSGAALPMFAEITDWLIDYYKLPPNEELK